MKKAILLSVLVLVLCGMVSGYEQDVSWIHGENPPFPSRYPGEPTIVDIIHFAVPTDVFRNQWIAEQTLGGIPTLSIDPVERTIELWIQEPAPDIPLPLLFDPVCGLEGYYGPLEEGSWLFYCHFEGTLWLDGFDVVPTPPYPNISGYVRTVSGLGISDVSLTFSNGGGSTTTDDSGYYTKWVPSGWSGVAMPSKSAYSFNPIYRSYVNVTSSISDQNYMGFGATPPIKGRIKLIGTAVKADEQEGELVGQGRYYVPVTIDEIIEDEENLLDDVVNVTVCYYEPLDIHTDSYGKVYVYGYFWKDDGPVQYRGRVDASSYPYYIIRLGDVSGNGEVSYEDASLAAQYGEGVLYLEPEQIWAADVDGNGQVDEYDEDLIFQYATGLIKRFPADDGTIDYFTEHFSSGTDSFDLSNKSIIFTPTKAGTFYRAHLKEITQLPTDPAGGTALALGDDNYKLVNLSDQATVFIFGSSFSSFYVGSNGYITFTEGDTDYTESLTDHFETMRISGLFNDLNPSAGGLVGWKQLADRVAVTWENVQKYGESNSNTFQIEMYFDGRIQLSWLGISVEKCIVGLSAGLGVPEDFQETDLSDAYPPPPLLPGFFAEQFSSLEDSFDLSNTSIIFKPTVDGTSYSAYLQEITQLPSDPAGGIELALGDDNYRNVKLSNQATVSIFGSSFSSFYVGSNGYITFTEGDNDHSESLSDHFDTRRISCLFNDLNPAGGGLVSWKQLADRVVVTWVKVPEYGESNSNTFQVEMYFDGRIRLSWLGIASENGIVGLSDGLGVPEDFEETDFSEI
ncbi:MAG: dockerin type I repeat-containing protein [Sedimentisphaerales bacterium]